MDENVSGNVIMTEKEETGREKKKAAGKLPG